MNLLENPKNYWLFTLMAVGVKIQLTARKNIATKQKKNETKLCVWCDFFSSLCFDYFTVAVQNCMYTLLLGAWRFATKSKWWWRKKKYMYNTDEIYILFIFCVNRDTQKQKTMPTMTTTACQHGPMEWKRQRTRTTQLRDYEPSNQYKHTLNDSSKFSHHRAMDGAYDWISVRVNKFRC